MKISENKDLIVDDYNELCSYENLETAFNRARKGKTLKEYVINFEKKLKKNLLQLRTELVMHTYQPKPLEIFILRDPKTRKISKSEFRDRVVHHAICNIIESVFDKRFIYDSFANRIGKGTLNAIKRFDTFKRKVSKNNTIKCYVLKADIKSYFDTVNQGILIKILSKQIHDDRIMWLIKIILDNHQGKEKNKGMPLGNLTSQFFANVYLNELDQFVKHKLKVKYYIRYVDDFVILHQSKVKLEEYKEKINQFLKEQLNIKLHPEKSQIIKLEKGIGFLGFRIFYHHKLIVKKNMRKFEKKMQRMKKLYQINKINREKIIEKYEGWIAYASNANTYKYRKRMTSKFNITFPAKPNIKITSVKRHENFNHKVDLSKIGFTQQKTLQLVKKGFTAKNIAEMREIKESTIWDHVANLVQHHQLHLKSAMPSNKIRKILNCIKSPEDKLKEIKIRLNDESISYNYIKIVLANVKGKHKKKSISYYAYWYQRTNCFRKCYSNKNQRKECRLKFQQLIAKKINMEFSKHEFLNFFHNHVNICILPDKDKKRFVSWKEFKKKQPV
ncbi:MAG: helix-turn-helix domain-containing protein [Nanoarchaeota archaeon]|nr:helix-turn-helix domain-containing protein [Nanoarchaeota archaeon]MBU4242316.1 helix-turn-helix domain-containing protein [Nanoarchaeota archaeon]MBU4351632.1 helix-turn-helix domain-containing protein [Nanoarchaeota archaeon]